MTKIKIILITLFLGHAFSLMAKNTPIANANDDWKTIKLDNDIRIIQPDYASAMGPQGIFNTCATPNEFRSINPVANCDEFKIIQLHSDSGEFGENREFKCTQVSPGQVRISRTTDKTICEESVSIENENKNATCIKKRLIKTLPADVKLEVVKNKGEEKGQLLFVKSFKIPNC